jgi:uncharacterized sulfatase
MMGHHGLWHKGNGRWLTVDETDPSGKYPSARPNMYDLSLRVPCIVSWPGTIGTGIEIESYITHLDLYPSLLHLAGIDKSEDLKLQGESFVPLLQGGSMSRDEAFFAQYLHLRCIQTPEWKYVYSLKDTAMNEFYDLIKDPGENVNLIDKKDQNINETSSDLKNRLFAIMEEIGDPGMSN